MKRKLIFLLLLIASCKSNTDADYERADKKTQVYFQLIKNSNIDSALKLFSADLYKHTDTADVVAALTEIVKTEGKITSVKLISQEKNTGIEGGEKRTNIFLTYQVEYSSGVTAEETFKYYVADGTIGKIEYMHRE